MTFACNQEGEELVEVNSIVKQFDQGVKEFRFGLNTTFTSLTTNLQLSTSLTSNDKVLIKNELLTFAKSNNFFNKGIVGFGNEIDYTLSRYSTNGRSEIDLSEFSDLQVAYIEDISEVFDSSSSLEDLKANLDSIIETASSHMSEDDLVPLQSYAKFGYESAQFGYEEYVSNGRVEEWNWSDFGKAAGLGALGGALRGAQSTGTIQGALIGAAAGALIGGILYTASQL